MPPLPFDVIHPDQYLESLDQRLTDSQIFESTIYTMMARTKKLAKRAFMATASVTGLQSTHGYTLAQIELKDTSDFLTYFTMESEVHDGLLIPTKRQAIVLRGGLINVLLTEAYLLGYDDGIDDDSIKDAADLSEYSNEDLGKLAEYSSTLASLGQ